ncbi:MAG: phosphate acyltransferase PlsX [Candidatus Dormibacteria bacterium]
MDAMGGDHAPGEIVRGALRAVTELDCNVVLVGRAEPIAAELVTSGARDQVTSGRISVLEASQVVGMDEHPAAAVRAKRDSSIVRACELVAGAKASGAVSAGNSGAVLAAALLTVKRAPGVSRPAIGAVVPTATGSTFILDAGANTDCKQEWLAQFAVMGVVYARTMMGVATPRVGLLSNGEEPGKGSALVQAASPLIAAAGVEFVGNVEGRDLFRGACDVAVTDGFTGNIALKTAEGVAELLFTTLRREARANARAKLGALLMKPRLRAVRDRVDYRRTGGALLLGVDGEIVIAHGRSDATAIMNAIKVAGVAAERGVSKAVASALDPRPDDRKNVTAKPAAVSS